MDNIKLTSKEKEQIETALKDAFSDDEFWPFIFLLFFFAFSDWNIFDDKSVDKNGNGENP